MPSLSMAEVRRLGQDHPHLAADPTYARLVMRRISPWVTWAIVRATPITADGVTWLAIASGLVAAGLVLVSTVPAFIGAAVSLQLAYLFDTVDGEVARVRGTSGRRGTYLDLIGHFVQNRALYGAAGYVLMVGTSFAPWAVLLAMVGVAFASPFGDQARLHVLGDRTGAAETSHGRLEVAPLPPGSSLAATIYWLYRRVAFLWNYPASMNLFTLALVADAIRMSVTSDARPLILPAFAAVFVGTLALKQTGNAVRLLGADIWKAA